MIHSIMLFRFSGLLTARFILHMRAFNRGRLDMADPMYSTIAQLSHSHAGVSLENQRGPNHT